MQKDEFKTFKDMLVNTLERVKKDITRDANDTEELDNLIEIFKKND